MELLRKYGIIKNGLTKEKIIQWSKINNINFDFTNKFTNFVPNYSAKDFPELKKEKLGVAIIEKNSEQFINSLK